MARPARPILSPDKIADAALDQVDRTGDFTIGSVAKALGVRPSSLYNHVDGRDAIIELMRIRLMPAQTPEHVGQAWDESLAELIRIYRESIGRHPRLVPLLTSATIGAPAIAALYERFCEVLGDAGFGAPELLDAITAIDTLALGSALDLAAPDEVWDRTTMGPLMRAAIDAAASGRARADQSFEFGLRILLDGFRARLDR